MKFTVTKSWQELPYQMFTILASGDNVFRLDTGDATPVGEGMAYRGSRIEKVADSKVWIKLDSSSTVASAVVDVANFI